jgi:hypothetical protein
VAIFFQSQTFKKNLLYSYQPLPDFFPLVANARQSQSEQKIMSDKAQLGAQAYTLVLPDESQEAFDFLLAKWCEIYHAIENTLLYLFVLKTAQAEWHRIRTQTEFNFFIHSIGGSAFNWKPEHLAMHDRLLRYKNAAERCFQREFRQLEQLHKSHYANPKPAPPPEKPADPAPPPKPPTDPSRDIFPKPIEEYPDFIITAEDPTSPTGYRTVLECKNGLHPDFWAQLEELEKDKNKRV